MAIKFEEVTYDEIKNISFNIEKSKITGVAGSSDSFKSTLVDLISGLILPQSGIIETSEKYDKIGIVYQDVDDQFMFDNIKKQFILTLKSHKVKNPEKKIFDSLKMFGLNKKILNKNYYELSTSEQKKISLALVLSYNPRILILDEVFTNLDNKSKESLIKIIRMMKIRYNKTIVLFSKDVDIIHRLCDNVLLINKGKIINSGNKYEVFSNEKDMKKCNLELPKLIKFSNIVKENKKIDIGYRDDINDLMKDIYRFVR